MRWIYLIPLLVLLSLSLFPWACGKNSTPEAPAPVTIVQLVTATFTPTGSPVMTFTQTNTPSATLTSTITTTPTSTWTPVTIVVTGTFTWTPTPTNSFTPTPTPTITHTPTLTNSPTITNTFTLTSTSTATSTPTVTLTATSTSTPCGNPGTMGDTNTVKTNSIGCLGPNTVFYCAYPLTTAGNVVLRDIKVLATGLSSVGTLRMAIYGQSGGNPSNLIVVSGTFTFTDSSIDSLTFNMPNVTLNTGETYYLCAFMGSADAEGDVGFMLDPITTSSSTYLALGSLGPTFPAGLAGAQSPYPIEMYMEFCQ